MLRFASLNRMLSHLGDSRVAVGREIIIIVEERP